VVRSTATSPQLRIKVLGPPQVLLGETPVSFTRHKALALLVYLAVSGRAHPRDALAALLSDAPTDVEARGQLRSTLKDLRARLGEYLVVTRDTISMAHDRSVWLDVAELEAAARNDASPAAAERLAQAVALYRGEFLAGFAVSRAPDFEGWLLRERERARAALLRLLTRLIDHAGAQGDLQAAMQWAWRLLEEEPWHEPTHRQLMRLLARAGQQEAALAQYETCRRALNEELGIAPQPETTALYKQLRAGPVAPRTNLPAPQAGFVGRETELALVAARLADPTCRLLTLLGLGGSGKTSLALRAAAAQAHRAPLAEEHPFADGVYLVDLATLPARPGSADRAALAMRRLATSIGRVLGLEFRGADPVTHLAAWLCERAVLLVLDNMEHLLDGAGLLTLLLQRSQRLKLLVTTRERLHLPEEWVLEVGGLPLPAGPDDVEQAPASRLYLQLMRQAGASGPPDALERAAIVRVCQLTHGLPLALALAARWTPSLPTAAIARELATGLDLLTTARGHRVPERQRSMRVILQATWSRLSDEERVAMRRLAVFQPGFTREAAQAVAGVERTTLLMLGKGALVGRDPTVERYAIHELVRQYAAEQLTIHPAEEGETRGRHAAFYASLVQHVTPALRQTVKAQEAISADSANIRAAWDWAAEHADAGILKQMLEGLATWYELQGLPGPAVAALERATERLRASLARAAMPDPSVERLLGFILVQEASALNWLASYDRARPLLEEARKLARVTASLHLEGRVAYCLGWLVGRQHDLRSAVQWLQQALVLARASREPDLEAVGLRQLGRGAVLTGDYPRAHSYLGRALALFRGQDDRLGEAGVLSFLGQTAHARGDFGEAHRLLQDALQLERALEYHLSGYFALHLLGQVYDEGWGRHVEAERYFAQDLRLTHQTGDRTHEGFALAGLGRNALYQGDLERAHALFDRALCLSREVTSQESAAMALRGQSLLAHYLGDDQRARRCAEDAIEIAQATGLRREERRALRLIGHALLGLGACPEAQVAYQQVVDLDKLLGFAHLRAETATDLARADLAQGDTAQALRRVAAILPDLEHGTLAGLEEPALVYLTCHRVLRAAGDARADAVLAAGQAFLQERAAQFVDEQRRAQFLDQLPAHRELLAAWHGRGGWTAGEAQPARAGASARLRVVRAESG
jgi:DNA-binding SARP family transcriptional activator/predicted ATPase